MNYIHVHRESLSSVLACEPLCEEKWLEEHDPTELGCIWVPESEVVLGMEACSHVACDMLDHVYAVIRC